MKLSLLLLLLCTILLPGCIGNKKQQTDTNQLVYQTAGINSGPLHIEPDLKGNIKQQDLSLQIKLSNAEAKDIEIQEITVNIPDGSNSTPTTAFTPFLLKQGNDTTLNLKFNPFNDARLYQVTGMNGSFKPAYNIVISYSKSGSGSIYTLSLKSIAQNNDFLAYSKKHAKSVIGYSFNTRNDFNEKQKRYLETLKQLPQPQFVFLSDQEIAVCGLNFRLKNFYLKDTLNAELFIVNHADFQVQITPDALDITKDGEPLPVETKAVTVEKVSGTQQNPYMMEKGDRVLIHFKKHVKVEDVDKQMLRLNIKEAFMLKNNKRLFVGDVELLPNHFD
ncbi:hypothetical protein [Mucilaginibacter flavidus]|uniref:hypothetical protein n=1 Tax=Mucilaginibacter flavidus TaxID=2949309 RepID=UPI002091E71C|nr:hypothetical protein [Mucilaginibacter flavidus]MCO5949469.1 hypothetical protein [Mucilaginibacter flavidus]